MHEIVEVYTAKHQEFKINSKDYIICNTKEVEMNGDIYIMREVIPNVEEMGHNSEMVRVEFMKAKDYTIPPPPKQH